jgi:hypothetical protein
MKIIISLSNRGVWEKCSSFHIASLKAPIISQGLSDLC